MDWFGKDGVHQEVPKACFNIFARNLYQDRDEEGRMNGLNRIGMQVSRCNG